jgi:polar amino acid transport system substrate-binding protein
MKQHICLVFIVSGLNIANVVKAESITVCYDQWAPMTIFPTDDSTDRGIVIDMVEQIYSESGYEVKYIEVPLARGLDMVSNGYCDMLPEYILSDTSDSGFEYADKKTFSYKTAFVIRKEDSWRYNGVESISNKRVATGPGWDYSSMSVDYQNYIDDPKNANFVEVIAGYDDVVDRIFRMIKEDRVDLYADNELVLQHILNSLGLNDELQIVLPGLEKDLTEYPIFSKKIPVQRRNELIEIWNNGRQKMKGPKEDALFKKYNVTLIQNN